MHVDVLQTAIESLWEQRAEVVPGNTRAAETVGLALERLDRGLSRVAEPADDGWRVNQWLKKAVLLSFRLHDSRVMPGTGAPAHDKVRLKTEGWTAAQFREASFRLVPGAVVRHSAFIGQNAILMPSFVNVGAYVDQGTMIDTWATVGSCAQVGKRCHISGGAGLGGVLEPLQADPVIIEDDCFIGARSEVVEGVRVGRGSVLAMGVFLSASTKIVDRETGAVHMGQVPPYSVVVPGTLPGRPLPDGTAGPGLACAVIIKTVDERTRSKTSLNDLLRD